MINEPREIKLSNYVESVKLRAEHIVSQFSQFTGGVRMLILLQRKKDGGYNNEERRMLVTRFTFHERDFKEAVEELLLLRVLYPESRLYSSVNPRNLNKIIRNIEVSLLDSHYTDDEQKYNNYKKLIRAPRHYVMQQSVKDDSFFIIDVDNEEGLDIYGDALKECERIGVEIMQAYPTKNGWHLITKPFNPALWLHKAEIKKDALILLDY